VKAIIRRRSAARKRRLTRRLDKHHFPDDLSQPMIRGGKVRYDVAGRTVATAYGGLGLIQQLVCDLGLAEAIDRRLQLFKVHLPYHESDHVLNLAYNALCAGTCLEDLELRRQDEAYLNLLGAERIPDPTTAGDFCRRFKRPELTALQGAYDEARQQVWSQQPAEFFAEARIEADGTMVETGAECKQGIDHSYKGVWGYHPLVLTLANTGEVLRLKNRNGNRPSHEGAPALFDECIALCRAAGFRRILLRGDTDFSQTEHLDRWHNQGDVRFIFGLDVTGAHQVRADDLPDSAWKRLKRPPKYATEGHRRARPKRVKQQRVKQRQFKDIRLLGEDVAEMPYRPAACKTSYRLVIVRKNLRVSEPKQDRLFEDYRYFLYLTNDWTSTLPEIVFSANDRCQQENVIAQLAAVRALHAPVDNLLSNEAYMLMTALAWNLKAWLALSLPDKPPEKHRSQQPDKPAKKKPPPSTKQRLLGLEFRTFVNYFLRIPAQVTKTGRQIMVRLLAYNDWQSTFLNLAAQFSRPRRC
jgi:hypothetical protein